MSKQLIVALSNKEHDLATLIISSGQFDLLSTDSQGQSAVHLASQNGYIKMLTWFSKLGFNLNARASDGATALHNVVKLRKLHAIKHLVKLGANVNSLTVSKQTPLHFAVTRDDKISLEISRILIQAGSHLDLVGAGGAALHIAARAGNLLQVKALLKAGADAQIADQNGETALIIAQKNRFERMSHLLANQYDDNLASDTDSEDEEGYNYTLPYSEQAVVKQGSVSVAGQPVCLQATIENIAIIFEEQWIAPNGDCAFIGLGTERKALTDTLRSYHNDSKMRKVLWPEIAESIMTGEFQPEGIEEILAAYYTAPADQLEKYCCLKKTFLAYLDVLEDTDKGVWLGYQSALLFAQAKDINLFIWRKGNGNTLDLINKSISESPKQTIHLLHTSGFTHFNLLIERNEIENSLDNLDAQLRAMSLGQKGERPSSSSENLPHAIAHYRGVHFYKEYFNRTQRRDTIKLHQAQSQEKVIPLGLHSSATHELAKQPILYPPLQNEDDYTALNKILTARERRLTQQDLAVSKRVSGWQNTGTVAPCLGGSKASRDSYSSRYIEYIQRYVNSYKTLMEDMANAPRKKIDGRSSERVKLKFQAFKSLQFTKLPFVSTSEEPHWGLEYATAILNWDKATHLPRTGSVTVLTPSYQRDGHPRFPYLGLLHVILHSQEDLSNGLSTRILDLFTKNEIDTKCSSPGGHIKGGYLKARERVFIGGIDAHHVKLSIIVRVPNFSHPYREFINDKYGIDENSYNIFKNKLSKHGRLRNDDSGMMANPNEFRRTEQEIIQHVIQQQEAVIEKRAAAIAEKLQLTLSYFGANSETVETQSLDIKTFIDQHDKQVRNLGKR